MARNNRMTQATMSAFIAPATTSACRSWVSHFARLVHAGLAVPAGEFVSTAAIGGDVGACRQRQSKAIDDRHDKRRGQFTNVLLSRPMLQGV
jgi:hypothetical protein